jgi:AcrR family transcriptional regulator
MTKRPDRRKPRTRRLLRDALIALILEKGYDAVTVQDITDRANLGRATFYLHFENGKDQLLMSSLREMFDDLKARITSPSSDISLGDMAMRMIPFQHAFEYRDLYRVTLLSQHGTAAIVNGIREYLAGSLRERIDVAIGDNQPLVPLDVLANYLAGAMISLISWWLKQDSNYTAEQMADMYRQLSMPTISTVLGLSSTSS